jgi:Methyltransferase domain
MASHEKKNALIVEFGGNHSETIPFFIDSFNLAGYVVYVFFQGAAWQESFLGDLSGKHEFYLIRSLDELIQKAQSSFFDKVVYNSARNLRVGKSDGVYLFKILLDVLSQQDILIQAHSHTDIQLDFVREFNTRKIAPTPLLEKYVDNYFIPYYDGLLGEQNISINLDEEKISLIKIGGIEAHSTGNIGAEYLLDAVKANIDVVIYASGKVKNPEIEEIIRSGGKILQHFHSSIIARCAVRNMSFLWIYHTPDGIYTRRTLSGAIPFSVNYGIPPILDVHTATIYSIHNGFLKLEPTEKNWISRLSKISPEYYLSLFSEWQLSRQKLINEEQERFVKWLCESKIKGDSKMEVSVKNSFQEYMLGDFGKVQGWCLHSVPYLIERISSFQMDNNISGGVMEIGVHHGKLFLALHTLTQGEERSLAIDLFDAQDLNVDKSGCGNEAILDENIKKLSFRPEFIDKLKVDSLSLAVEDVANLQRKYGKFRIISIDGGHTPEHTIHDFNIAQNLLANGGLVIVDNINNIDWPGVYEGIAYIFLKDRPKLVPFLVGANKLFLTTLGFHSRLFAHTLNAINSESSQNLKAPTKRVKMFGHDVIAWRVKSHW